MTTMTEPTTRTLEAPGRRPDLRRPAEPTGTTPPGPAAHRLADGRRAGSAPWPATSPTARS